MCVESSATTDTTYTLTAEQDNWVYAPEGGVFISDATITVNFNKTIPVVQQAYIAAEDYVNFDILMENNHLNKLYEDCVSMGVDSIVDFITSEYFVNLLIKEGVLKKASAFVPIVNKIFLMKTVFDALSLFGQILLQKEYVDALQTGNGNLIYIEDHSLHGSGITYQYAHWYPWTNRYINKYSHYMVRGNVLVGGAINEDNLGWMFD